MESVLIMNRPREIVFQEYEPGPLEPDHVRVRTRIKIQQRAARDQVLPTTLAG